jgi:hypothetical protein
MSESDGFNRNVYWITALVFFAISIPAVWYVSRSEGFHNGYQQRETEQIEQKADSDLRGKCSFSANINEAINCAEGVVKAEAEQGHDARDLEAQWQSATWGKLMLVQTGLLGTLTVILTYFGVVLLRRTLHEASLTTKAANAAADSANASNQIMRDAFIADQRPWITIDAELAKPSEYIGSEFRIPIKFTIKNVGKVPAVNTWNANEIYVDTGQGVAIWDVQKTFCRRIRTDFEKAGGGTVGDPTFAKTAVFPNVPLEEEFNFSLTINLKPITEYDSGHTYLAAYIIGCVVYRNPIVIESVHQTWFIFEVATPNGGRPLFRLNTPMDEIVIKRYFVGGYAD